MISCLLFRFLVFSLSRLVTYSLYDLHCGTFKTAASNVKDINFPEEYDRLKRIVDTLKESNKAVGIVSAGGGP